MWLILGTRSNSRKITYQHNVDIPNNAKYHTIETTWDICSACSTSKVPPLAKTSENHLLLLHQRRKKGPTVLLLCKVWPRLNFFLHPCACSLKIYWGLFWSMLAVDFSKRISIYFILGKDLLQKHTTDMHCSNVILQNWTLQNYSLKCW